jgi:hypothetical protein
MPKLALTLVFLGASLILPLAAYLLWGAGGGSALTLRSGLATAGVALAGLSVTLGLSGLERAAGPLPGNLRRA